MEVPILKAISRYVATEDNTMWIEIYSKDVNINIAEIRHNLAPEKLK